MSTAKKLVTDARSVADLQNTQTISYNDTVTLINESWRTLYSAYTESDGDFWVKEVVITPDTSMIDPNNPYAYLIPLPTDFYKIRSLSWNTGTQWTPVQRFSMSQRDMIVGVPLYRIKNDVLWVIGSQGTVPTLKLDYYIPPVIVTLPKDDLPFDTIPTGVTSIPISQSFLTNMVCPPSVI